MAAFRVMKYAVLILFIAFSPAVLAQAQKPKPNSVRKATTAKAKAAPTPTPAPLSEKEQFDNASGLELAADRVAALDKFLVDFPQSENRPAATELLASSRILIAEEKLLSGDFAEAVEIYRKVISDHPVPFPADLYADSISKIPQTLFFRGQRTAAVELATMIEAKVESDAGQLLELATFYLRIENGAEAMRIAAKAAAKDPSSAAVYRTIALAHRINFDLELSADSYAKSLELDPESVTAKRGLAEMKRALGKSEEAVILYRDLLSKNEDDVQSRQGLVLALFESNKRAEAEAELAKSLEKTPNNFSLLAGAAYWYASRGVGDKAVALAEKALNIEPRYIWSHIALARGFVKQGKPVAAELVLIKARAYASFPTLEYELASVRMSAGFFREAVDDLAKHFSVTEDGVKTRLGGRISRTETSFAELAAAERRASIFAHAGPDSADDAERLRGLLLFDEELQKSEPNEEKLAAAADVFTGGTDKMRFHRQVFAASEMLKRRLANAKVLELAKAVTGNSDAALDIADPVAAVMATELYDARQAAFRKNDFLLIPDVPRATLSAILRERIEEIAGWALYQQGNYADAAIRLRRAVTVAPPKSAWWRSSMWRLGAALAADGKDAEALAAYIESYKDDKPDFGKYAIVETLYKKVNGSIDGLEEKIGRERVVASSGLPVSQPASEPSTTVESPSAIVTTDNSSTQVSPPVISVDRSRDLLKPIPAGVPVATKTDVSETSSKTVRDAASSVGAVPAATPAIEVTKDEPIATPPTEVKKEEPPPVIKADETPALDVKKEEPPVIKTDETPVLDAKKEELRPAIKLDEPPPSDAEKKEPMAEVEREEPPQKKDPPPIIKTDEPLPFGVKKEEPPLIKTDEPPPSGVKKEESPLVIKTDEPLPFGVKKEEPPLIKTDEPPPSEVKKEEPPLVIKADEPLRSEVKKEEPPAIKTNEPPTSEVTKEEPAVAQPAGETKRDEPTASPPITEQKPDEPLLKEDPPPAAPADQKNTDPAPEKKAEQKPKVVKTDLPPLRVDDEKAAARKPLFEPIIIGIPDSRRPKPATTETALKTDDKPANDENSKKENSIVGNARPRVIDGQEVKVDDIPPCTINVSQERIVLLSSGVGVGLLVGFEGPGDINTLTGTSSSPKDLQVTLEPEISGIPDRRFFSIKSLSKATGAFQVTFTMPCATRDILVTVR